MPSATLSDGQRAQVEALVAHYSAHDGPIRRFLASLDRFISEADSLEPLIHSVKKRMKDPDHLRDKLARKILKAQKEEKEFDITTENLFTRITDLGGYRIL